MVGKTAVKGNWQNFLRADSNKTELYSFLSKVLLQAFCKEDKEVVLIDKNGVLAHSYCRMSTPWPQAATKKLIVVCCCTYHTLHSTRCSFALLTPMLWSWLCLPYVICPLGVNCSKHSELARAFATWHPTK